MFLASLKSISPRAVAGRAGALALLGGILGLLPCESARSQTNAPVVAATVNGEPITTQEVDVALRPLLKGQTFARDAMFGMQAYALDQLIKKKLINANLKRAGHWPQDREIDQGMSNLQAKLATQNMSFNEFLRQSGANERIMREQIAFAIAWQRFMASHKVDYELAKHFEAKRRDLDGTRLRVSHILLRPARAGDDVAVQKLFALSRQIKQEIESGKITFEAAAKKYSAGPSRNNGGDLGFISRQEPMSKGFNDAAFALKSGEISKPVATPYGVHLIRVTDEHRGEKKWSDMREILEKSLETELTQKLAAEEAKVGKVEFTGNAPFFQPGTQNVVVPKKLMGADQK